MFPNNLNVLSVSAFLLFINSAFAMEMPTIEKKGCQTVGNSKQCQYKSGTTTIYMITHMPYALCAQAKCQIDEKNNKISNCQCPIYGLNDNEPGWKSISLSDKPFAQVKPVYSGNKLSKVTSNFSLAMLDSIKNLDPTHTQCTGDKPLSWANCFGVVCDVSYVDDNGTKKAQANCQCPVSSSLSFVSSGPANTDECELTQGQVWSAADENSGAIDFELITQSYQNYQNMMQQTGNASE